MGIKLTTPQSLISIYFVTAIKILDEEVNNALAYLGEQMLVKIRNRSQSESWIDQTGNLRSSIGYAIYNQGMEKLQSAFNVILSGNLGAEEGQKVLRNLSRQYAQTYALVVVAGMDYASYVEAKENKDVLASTNLWAKSIVDEYIQKALQKAQKRIDAIKL